MQISTTTLVGFSQFGDPYHFVKKHLVFLLIGCILYAFAWLFPHRKYKDLALPGMIVSTIMLGLVFVPSIGVLAGGGASLDSLGSAGLPTGRSR